MIYNNFTFSGNKEFFGALARREAAARAATSSATSSASSTNACRFVERWCGGKLPPKRRIFGVLDKLFGGRRTEPVDSDLSQRLDCSTSNCSSAIRFDIWTAARRNASSATRFDL